MKIKNLAFFGIMASILSVGGAHAADTTRTVIASQAYVDAHAGNTDMHVDTTNKQNWNDAYEAAVTDATDENALTADEDALTKAKAIQNMMTQTVAATGGTSTTLVPSEAAVRAAITAAEEAASADLSTLETQVQTNTTNIATNADDISTNATEIAKRAVTDNKNGTYNITDGDTSIDVYTSKDLYDKTTADSKFELAANKWDKDLKNATAPTAQFPTVDAVTKAIDDASDSKADKATTLAGYGITDAYTKSEVYTKSDVYTKSETDTELEAKEDTSNKWNQDLVAATSPTTQFPTVNAVQVAINNVSSSVTAEEDRAKEAEQSIIDSVETALELKADAAEGLSEATDLRVVKHTAQGIVSDSTAAGTLAIFQETGSTGVNAETLAQLNCSDGNPCILSYTGKDTSGKAVYKWTPMVFPTASN